MADACCGPTHGCVFAKAVLARAASCPLAQRRSVGERELLECRSPVARTNCDTLAALMRERARFALRLPAPSEPLMHAQAMRLQCGGLAGLQQVLTTTDGQTDEETDEETVETAAGQAAGDSARARAGDARGPAAAPPPPADVHALVQQAQARHGSLTALPWDTVVAAMRGWSPRRRHAPAPR